MQNSWIKIHRKFTEWEWYTDGNTMRLFIHLLITANYKDLRFMGHSVPRGSLVTGRKQLSIDLNISEQSVRTSLNHLEKTEEVTRVSYPQFSIISINNYDNYQQVTSYQPATNQLPTSYQPATNQLLTTSKESKKERRKERKKDIYSEDLFFAKDFYKKKGEQYIARTGYTKNKELLIEEWSDIFRLLRERDKIHKNDIQLLIDYVFIDNFWKNNFLSPMKFRKKLKNNAICWRYILPKAKEMLKSKTIEFSNLRPYERNI